MNSLKKALRIFAALEAMLCFVPSSAYAQQGLSDAGAYQSAYAAATTGSVLPATGDDLGMGVIVLTALGVLCLIAAFLVLAHGIRSTKTPRSAAHSRIDRTRKP